MLNTTPELIQLIFVIPTGISLLALGVYLHELGHKTKFKKFGIPSKVHLGFSKAYCLPNESHFKEFDALPLSAKKEICYIGPTIDKLLLVTYLILFITVALSVNLLTHIYIGMALIALAIFELTGALFNSDVSKKGSDAYRYEEFKQGKSICDIYKEWEKLTKHNT